MYANATKYELLLELSTHYFATNNPMRVMNGYGCVFLKGSKPKECLQKDPVIRRSSLIILWKAGSIFRFSGLVLVLLGSDRYSWLTGQIKLSTSWNCELSFLTSVKMYVHFVIKRKYRLKNRVFFCLNYDHWVKQINKDVFLFGSYRTIVEQYIEQYYVMTWKHFYHSA